ncbi:MAG: response regulator [Herminiimonas sp.]|nr:response regulator [Herminiimonas sp.]
MTTREDPKILVVNDDPGSLLALTSLLSQWVSDSPYEIVTARSGEEALRQVLLDDFAVILLDVNMPGMDGFETAEAIHARPRSSAIPIIFITAYHADELNRLKGYQKGAADYLFTPIIPQVLRAKVTVFVALARKNLELRQQALKLNQRTDELIATNARLSVEIKERRQAVRENKAKDDFLAMLGHELRNPLNAINSAIAVIGFAGVNAESANRARTIIARQSRHLSRIVDDLLDLSRVMSGKIMLSRQSLELSGLVASCVETLKTTGRTAGYLLEIDSEVAWVDADPTRIEQVISNLLDNAFKYTPQGGEIHIHARSGGSSVVLEIRDSGVGIAADLLPHVFDVFVQGESSLDRAQGGLGIGLALVRQLIELHGGSIEAHSDGLGLGSAFIVRLPSAAPAQIRQPVAYDPMPALQYRILLIEDNEDGRDMMRTMLTEYGHVVLEAADGLEGLRIAAQGKPDIALVDIGLPTIDGYEVARRLRADPATAEVRLIALTGYGLAEDQRLAIEAGFDLHLVKPVNFEHLLAAIGRCQRQTVQN